MILCRDQGRYAEFDALIQPQLCRQVYVSARCLVCLIDAERNDLDPLFHQVADCLADCGDDRPTQPVRRLRIATRKP